MLSALTTLLMAMAPMSPVEQAIAGETGLHVQFDGTVEPEICPRQVWAFALPGTETGAPGIICLAMPSSHADAAEYSILNALDEAGFRMYFGEGSLAHYRSDDSNIDVLALPYADSQGEVDPQRTVFILIRLSSPPGR